MFKARTANYQFCIAVAKDMNLSWPPLFPADFLTWSHQYSLGTYPASTSTTCVLGSPAPRCSTFSTVVVFVNWDLGLWFIRWSTLSRALLMIWSCDVATSRRTAAVRLRLAQATVSRVPQVTARRFTTPSPVSSCHSACVPSDTSLQDSVSKVRTDWWCFAGWKAIVIVNFIIDSVVLGCLWLWLGLSLCWFPKLARQTGILLHWNFKSYFDPDTAQSQTWLRTVFIFWHLASFQE